MAGEHHGDAVLVARLDGLLVAHGAAGLDDGSDAPLGQRVHVVAEREERVGRAHQALGLHAHALARLMGALARQQRAVHAVGLARAHADAGVVARHQDGVGLHALAHAPCEHELVHLGVRGLAIGGNGETCRILGHVVDVLHQHAAVDGTDLDGSRGVDAAGAQHAQVLLLLQKLKRGGLELGGDEHLDELLVLVDVLDHLQRDLAGRRDDAAEGALRVAGEGLVVGLGDVLGRGGTAGVLVLQDDDRRLVELAHERPARVGVQDVVVGQLLAVELLGVDQAVLMGELVHAVEDGLLMRVLAVAQVLLLLHVQGALGRELALGLDALLAAAAAALAVLVRVRGLDLVEQEVGDGAVVGVGGLEHLEGQFHAGLARGGAAVGAHLGKDALIGIGVGNHGDALEVLRGAAQHGGTADVDVLDAGAEVRAGLDRLLERIQVHDHHVDHLDAVLCRLGHVLGVVALGQQAAVHHGMQGLHATVHHLGELRHLVDGRDRHAGLRDDAGGAARGDDLRAEFVMQRAGELDDARLVRHRDEYALDLRICHLLSPYLEPFLLSSFLIAKRGFAPKRCPQDACFGVACRALAAQAFLVARPRLGAVALRISYIDQLGHDGDSQFRRGFGAEF